MKAWFFSNTNCHLNYGDNRQIKPGAIHTVQCKPIMCQQGLHASVNILGALGYAPGPYIWRVNLSDSIIQHNNKAVAKSREYLWGLDAIDILSRYARMCALDVVHLWDAPDIVIKYLKTGDNNIKAAALGATKAAASAAPSAAPRAAALAGASAGAWAAASAAAWDAAWAAASAGASAAAWDVARAAQSNRLYRMVLAAYRSRNI